MVAMPAPVTTADFLRNVRLSGLVDAERLDRFAQTLDTQPADGPRTVASRMIDDGLITNLQAGLLKQGKTKNFLNCGKYKLLEHIGAGGMGQVFLCEQIKRHRRVAVVPLYPRHIFLAPTRR